MTLEAATRLGPYEIVSPLGAGGMGEVYKAKDTRLGRLVAIKVLLGHHAEDPAMRERFEREAQAISALSHPSICTLFDVGEHEGTHFLVMEYLEGETLAARLTRGALPLDQALKVGTEIATALSAAHSQGIVHRDLKPGNVMLTKGGVKLLDFGLAKLHAASHGITDPAAQETASGPLTAQGAIVGTLQYMAPEQLQGKDADARSDIFAFGCVLYEMISGRRAFAGETQASVIGAILHEEPAPLGTLLPLTPPAVDQIVRHCLEKDRDDRFQTAKDIVFALSQASAPVVTSRPTEAAVPAGPESATGRRAQNRNRLIWAAVGGVLVAAAGVTLLVWHGRGGQGSARVTATSQATKPPRIVVLPFENLGTPEDAYFAAGMTEEISSRLANLQGLAVISRTTAIGYDRKGKTIKQIGTDLGVDYVLEGTIFSDRNAPGGGRVRITPELIQVADDTHVWADRYDRVLSDIFAIQSEVAESVVRAMGIKLVPRERTALKTASTTDTEAYELYLRGLEITRRGETRENLEGGLRMYQAAVDRDPRFSQALLQLARNHLVIYFTYMDRSREHLDKGKAAVDQLATIGPDLAETHIARGDYAYWGLGDYSKALEEFKAALALQPSSTDTLEVTGYVLRRQSRWEEAADQLLKWVELDPRNPLALYQYGLACVHLRRYPEADRALALSTSLNPQFGTPWNLRALVQISWRGDIEEAHAVLSEARQVPGLQDGTGEVGIRSFQIALMRKDFRGALRQLDGEKREAFSNQSHFIPLDLYRGQAHALLGEHDLARQSFEAARHRLQELVSKDPQDSRYQSYLGIACAALGLREEALAAANRGTELMPPPKDALKAMFRIEHLALVETMLGQYDEAIDRLDFLLSQPGTISAQVLRLDPRWEPLRSNPRFQALLAKYNVKP